MCKYIYENYIPQTINGHFLNKKGQILNITGPDTFTKGINQYIHKTGETLHRTIDYNLFASLNYDINYKKMYKINIDLQLEILKNFKIKY